MATRPAAFRPSRKSMGAVIEKENFSQQSEIITDELITIPTTKRKRAQSLGGNEPIAKKVAPRRSILKSGASLVDEYAETMNFSGIKTINRLDDSDSEDSESEDGGNADPKKKRVIRNGAEDRRKSLARRVSFAPNAFIRTFTPDKPTAQAQEAAKAASFESPTQSSQDVSGSQITVSLDSDEAEDVSMEVTEEIMAVVRGGNENTMRGGGGAFSAHFLGSIPASVYAEDEEQEQDVGDLTFDMQKRRASIGVFEDDDDEGAMTDLRLGNGDRPRKSVAFPDQFSVEEEEEDEDDTEEEDQTAAMDMTMAIPSTIIKTQIPPPSTSQNRRKSRASMRPQDSDDSAQGGEFEDDEDEGAMEDLRLGKGNRPRKSVGRPSVGFRAGSSEDEDDADTDTDDRTMAFAVRSTVASLPVSQKVGFAGVDDEEEDEELGESEKTMEMEEIIEKGVATPSTASARLQAQLFARQSLHGIAPGTIPIRAPNSPRRSLPRVSMGASPNPVIGKSPHVAQRGFANSPIPNSPINNKLSNRSPGGSLSLRGMLLQGQLNKNQPASPSSLAQPSTSISTRKTFGSPSRKVNLPTVGSWESPTVGGWESPIQVKSKGTKREEGIIDENLAMDGSTVPFVKTLKEFLEIVNISFFDEEMHVSDPRTKPIPEGPPATIGDIVVAGGAQYLYWQLYHADETSLADQMNPLKNGIQMMTQQINREIPSVFREWALANDSQRVTLQNQLGKIDNKLKYNSIIEWNQFRLGRLTPAVHTMELNLEGLRADVNLCETSKFDEILIGLQKRKQLALDELHEERNRDIELITCDQEILLEKRSAVIEQAAQVEVHAEKFNDLKSSLKVLTDKTNEISLREEQLNEEVDLLRKQSEEGRSFTKSNLLRMNDEFECISYLHCVKIQSFNQSSISLLFYNELQVILHLTSNNKTKTVKSVQIELAPTTESQPEWKMNLKQFLLKKVLMNINWVINSSSSRVKPIIQRILSLWLNALQLIKEFRNASLRYPLSSSLTKSQNRDNLIISIKIHSPLAKATFSILTTITGEELLEGELKRPIEVNRVVEQLSVEVKTLFGSINCGDIACDVRETIETFGKGAILVACDAAEKQSIQQ